MKTGKPDDERVDALYAMLYGKTGTQSWDGEKRNHAQQIIYIEDACKNVLAAIQKIESCETIDEAKSSLKDLKHEFQFLRTLMQEKAFLRSLDYLTRD